MRLSSHREQWTRTTEQDWWNWLEHTCLTWFAKVYRHSQRHCAGISCGMQCAGLDGGRFESAVSWVTVSLVDSGHCYGADKKLFAQPENSHCISGRTMRWLVMRCDETTMASGFIICYTRSCRSTRIFVLSDISYLKILHTFDAFRTTFRRKYGEIPGGSAQLSYL